MSLLNMLTKKMTVPGPGEALPGRADPILTAETHAVSGVPLKGPYPEGSEQVVFAMGCFWGAERLFWQTEGVLVTAVGYIGGETPNPTYNEVCSGLTGHTEGVLIVYDPAKISFDRLLQIFWEGHDPTQGMRQGNDVGTQYRSAIFVADEERRAKAETSRTAYNKALAARGLGRITTEILGERPFYFAEDYHQQYLHKVPNGYCGLGGTGVSCPVGTGVDAAAS
ncbi:peptide-methionine (S)-S-oxide reductase MsrA [Amorphus sp. 3PC139-8]|uniref:peptide-methionine (S)-S-oxide reductase MsrA n=1 Tax=Amorphus sp. 3PC139-8 TaxID=2735676 RepID=UPI00345D195B